MTLNTSTLGDDVWALVFNHLKTGTYEISADNIHSSYNDSLLNSEGFPQVIIGLPRVSRKKVTLNSSSTGTYDWEIAMDVEVYHSSNERCKKLMDEVRDSLTSGLSVFEAEDLDMLELPKPKEDWTDRVGGKTHILSFELVFQL
jgi:hypothetical protein